MSVDYAVLSHALKDESGKVFNDLLRSGITADHFTDDAAKIWTYLHKAKNQKGTIPSAQILKHRYPNFKLQKVRSRDLPHLLSEIQRRKKYMDFMMALDNASRVVTPEDIDVALATLQRDLNGLSVRNGKTSIVDLFGEEAQERIMKDLKRRRSGLQQGFPTGLNRLDVTTGGLQKGRMVTVIGRPGLGKSWLDLLFVASAVQAGGKVVLYPLEMTLEETAMRLYTIFSCKRFGPSKSLKNLDLANGRVSPKKVAKLLGQLEDKYQGQLFVADIGSMTDPYTVDRIEAEMEIYRPDMFWVDYITLMKAPGVGREGGEDHMTVKALSNGIKQVAVRQNVIGGASAQVNREAMRVKTAALPRLENIAYGDSIGQDADHVISITRQGPHLYYGMVKNRHGPEIGKTRVKFFVNDGLIEDDQNQEEDDE